MSRLDRREISSDQTAQGTESLDALALKLEILLRQLADVADVMDPSKSEEQMRVILNGSFNQYLKEKGIEDTLHFGAKLFDSFTDLLLKGGSDYGILALAKCLLVPRVNKEKLVGECGLVERYEALLLAPIPNQTTSSNAERSKLEILRSIYPALLEQLPEVRQKVLDLLAGQDETYNKELGSLIEVIGQTLDVRIGFGVRKEDEPDLDRVEEVLDTISSQSNNYLLGRRAEIALSNFQAIRRRNGEAYADRDMAYLFTKSPALLPNGKIVSPLAKRVRGVYRAETGRLEGYVDEQRFELKNILNLTGKDDFDLQLLLSVPFRRILEDDFGLDIATLSLDVQRHFLHYLQDQPRDRVLRMADYAKKYGQNFFITYLSTDHDFGMGDKIMVLCESYGPDKVAEILQEYAQVAEASEEVRSYLARNLGNQTVEDGELTEAVIQNLLKKGKRILIKASEGSFTDTDSADLNIVSPALHLFHSTLLELQARNIPIEISDFKDTLTEDVPGTLLSNSDRDQMSAIVESNWLGQGKEGEKVVEDFKHLLIDQDRLSKTNFYILRHAGKVAAFFRLDQNEDHLYLGSVNAPIALKGVKLGTELLDSVFCVAARGSLVRAECNPTSPVSAKYIGDYGFIATDIYEYASPNDTLAIERDTRGDALPCGLFSGKSFPELANLRVLYSDNEDRQLQFYTFPDDKLSMKLELEKALKSGQGLVVTAIQYGKAEKNGGSYPVVVGLEKMEGLTNLGQRNVSRAAQTAVFASG